MFVLSAGMPKSGSGYFYNIINELLVSSRGSNAREIKDKRQLESLMQWHNNNIGKLQYKKLLKLWLVSLQEGPFVVKTHDGPEKSTHIFKRLGMMKIIYSFRDPRDALLSALDHGKQLRAGGETHTFAKLLDLEFDQVLERIKEWLAISEAYSGMGGVLMLRYEDMLADPVHNIRKIEKFLRISITDEMRQEILWKYSKNNPSGEREGTHFNKAKAKRFMKEMATEEIQRCNEVFGPYLDKMGYALD